MTDIFQIVLDGGVGTTLQRKSRTRGIVTETGGISLPDTSEALGIDVEFDDSGRVSGLQERVQEIVAGRANLAGIGAEIEDDLLDQEHDPLLPSLYADDGISLSALLALDLIGIKVEVQAYRTRFNAQLEQIEGRGPKRLLTGNVALNNRVHWFADGRRSGITISGGLSETMRLALIGEPLASLLSHPRLDPLGLRIVDGTTMNDGRLALFETDHRSAPQPLRAVGR